MPYKDVALPAGEKITRTDRLNVPDRPIIPFIRGDGTGPDIWAASERVFDAAVEKAYDGKKRSHGLKSSRVSRQRTNSMNGCRTTQWRRSGSIWLESKDR